MSISYPLTLPTTKSPAQVVLTVASVVAVSRSNWTLATQIQQFDGMAWSAEISYPLMTRADGAAEMMAFLLKLNGQQGTFLLGDPTAATPRGSASGSPQVSGSNASGQQVLNTKGWTNSAANVLRAGDYIALGQRMYFVLNDVSADGSGNASLDIWPQIREAPSNNDTITTASCKCLFRLATNSFPLYDTSYDKNYTIAFSAIEAI